MPDNEDTTQGSSPPAPEGEERLRRHTPRPDVELPKGYRSSRRGSRALKQAKKAKREQRMLRVWDKTRKTSANVVWLAGMILAGLAVAGVVLWGGAWVVNSVVRWNAKRFADGPGSERERQARENVLVIAVDPDENPVGFLAMRYDQEGNQVFGVAIPDGAFLEVPGQGFERLGDSLAAGPEVSVAAVSNYLGVPVDRYATVTEDAYQAALTDQDVTALLADVTTPDATNISSEELATLQTQLAETTSDNTALVPLPVKPIKLGSQTYFEPQRAEIADLLKTWWGVDVTNRDATKRVIIYNGAGVPGIAGEAAQQLIRAGYRVVDTKNADNFKYKKTQVVVQRGDKILGEQAAEVLKVGEVSVQPADQDVADLIIIIGKDFKPQSGR